VGGGRERRGTPGGFQAQLIRGGWEAGARYSCLGRGDIRKEGADKLKSVEGHRRFLAGGKVLH